MSAGRVTSTSPFNELKDIGLSGVTRARVTVISPFTVLTTTFPEMFFRVFQPLTFSTSISPLTFSTTISPSFVKWSSSDEPRGTWIVMSTAYFQDSALMETTLFDSSTSRPVLTTSIFFMPRPWRPCPFLPCLRRQPSPRAGRAPLRIRHPSPIVLVGQGPLPDLSLDDNLLAVGTLDGDASHEDVGLDQGGLGGIRERHHGPVRFRVLGITQKRDANEKRQSQKNVPVRSVHVFLLFQTVLFLMRMSPFMVSSEISGPPRPARTPKKRSLLKTNFPLFSSRTGGGRERGHRKIRIYLAVERLERKSAETLSGRVTTRSPLIVLNAHGPDGAVLKPALSTPFTVSASPEPAMSLKRSLPLTL